MRNVKIDCLWAYDDKLEYQSGGSMTITITDELEEFINKQVKSGAYKSADEVIIASLRLLKVREKGMEALRREIMCGVEDIQQGRFIAYE
jgi:antitoxin ParD1/3/4